jgi:hypothetical protein
MHTACRDLVREGFRGHASTTTNQPEDRKRQHSSDVGVTMKTIGSAAADTIETLTAEPVQKRFCSAVLQGPTKNNAWVDSVRGRSPRFSTHRFCITDHPPTSAGGVARGVRFWRPLTPGQPGEFRAPFGQQSAPHQAQPSRSKSNCVFLPVGSDKAHSLRQKRAARSAETKKPASLMAALLTHQNRHSAPRNHATMASVSLPPAPSGSATGDRKDHACELPLPSRYVRCHRAADHGRILPVILRGRTVVKSTVKLQVLSRD